MSYLILLRFFICSNRANSTGNSPCSCVCVSEDRNCSASAGGNSAFIYIEAALINLIFIAYKSILLLSQDSSIEFIRSKSVSHGVSSPDMAISLSKSVSVI